MKRKNASLLGNVLMGLGLVVMVVGVGYSILNQLPQFNMPQYFAHGAVPFSGWRVPVLAGMNRCATVTGGFATMTNVAAVAIIAVIANKYCSLLTSQFALTGQSRTYKSAIAARRFGKKARRPGIG